MDKTRNLQEKAAVLRSLLEKYAQTDIDAEIVLGFMTPLFGKIRAGELVPPHENEYRWNFASTEAPLFKYDDLCEAAAEYGHALQDWEFAPPR